MENSKELLEQYYGKKQLKEMESIVSLLKDKTYEEAKEVLTNTTLYLSSKAIIR